MQNLQNLLLLSLLEIVTSMMKDIFGKALGINKPWFVADVNFDLAAKRLDINLDFTRGATFPFEQDGIINEYKAYDTVEKEWRHLNFFEHECYLKARVPRIKTPDDKIHLMLPAWSGLQNGFTLLFEALIMQLCKSMPVHNVAYLVKTSDHKIWSILTGSRYIFLKNEKNLTVKERLKKEGLQLSKLNNRAFRALSLRETFQQIYVVLTNESFEKLLKKWYFWATHSQLEPMKQVASTIKKHWDGILRWKTSQINNGILEGLNSVVQAAKRKARGYKFKHFKTILYLITGGLDFRKANSTCVF